MARIIAALTNPLRSWTMKRKKPMPMPPGKGGKKKC